MRSFGNDTKEMEESYIYTVQNVGREEVGRCR